MKKIGADVQHQEMKVSKEDPWDYNIYGGHNAWEYAYADTTLVDWFLQYPHEE